MLVHFYFSKRRTVFNIINARVKLLCHLERDNIFGGLSIYYRAPAAEVEEVNSEGCLVRVRHHPVLVHSPYVAGPVKIIDPCFKKVVRPLPDKRMAAQGLQRCIQ